MFVEEFKRTLKYFQTQLQVNSKLRRDQRPIWIMKPVSSSQGKGIFLFKDLKDIQEWKRDGKDKKKNDDDDDTVDSYIVQRYIEKPLLIGGRKSDMRIYVLVTSYEPLNAWVYREGFVRFSGSRFTTDQIKDSFVHLTNVAIQKKAPEYNPNQGAKWPLRNIRRYLTEARGVQETKKAFKSINQGFPFTNFKIYKLEI